MEDREKEIRITVENKATWANAEEWNEGWKACVYLLSKLDEERAGGELLQHTLDTLESGKPQKMLVDMLNKHIQQLEAVADAAVEVHHPKYLSEQGTYQWDRKVDALMDTLRAAGKIKE